MSPTSPSSSSKFWQSQEGTESASSKQPRKKLKQSQSNAGHDSHEDDDHDNLGDDQARSLHLNSMDELDASQAEASAAGDPSSSAVGDTSQGKGYRRSYKACDSCRARKIRCDLGDLDAPSDPPCKRCKRERQECTFTTGVRGNRHGRSNVSARAASSSRRSTGSTSAAGGRGVRSESGGDTSLPRPDGPSAAGLPATGAAPHSREHSGSSESHPSQNGTALMPQHSFPQQPPPPPLHASHSYGPAPGYPITSGPPPFRGSHPTNMLNTLSSIQSPTSGILAPPPPPHFGPLPPGPALTAALDPIRGGYSFAPNASQGQMIPGSRNGASGPPSYPAGAVNTYGSLGQRGPPSRPSFAYGPNQGQHPPLLPQPNHPPLAAPTGPHHGAPALPHFGSMTHGKSTAPSPRFSNTSSSPGQGPSPSNSNPLSKNATMQTSNSSPAGSSSASPAASADSSRISHRGRGLKRSHNGSSPSIFSGSGPGSAAAGGSGSGGPGQDSGAAIDRAALAQVNLQNSRDALKLLATLAGGAKHPDEERVGGVSASGSASGAGSAHERDRDRSRERGGSGSERVGAMMRERSRDRGLRDRSRDRLRDRSRERSRERQAAFVSAPPEHLGPGKLSAQLEPTSAGGRGRSDTPTSRPFPGAPAISSALASSSASGLAFSSQNNTRSSANSGAVHRMQRPNSAASPQPSSQQSNAGPSTFAFRHGNGADSQADGREKITRGRALAPVVTSLTSLKGVGADGASGSAGPAHSGGPLHRIMSASAPSTPRGESAPPKFGSRPGITDPFLGRDRSREGFAENSARAGAGGQDREVAGGDVSDEDDEVLWPRKIYSRQTTPQKPSRAFTLADFEPVRLKIVKRGEVKMLLVEREPILLGAILSIASRYCHSAARDVWPDQKPQDRHAKTSKGQGSSNGGFPQPVSWKTHLEISSWTHAKVGRALFDPLLHTIGTVEALLMLSEWSTIDMDAADMLDPSSKLPDRNLGNEDDDEEDVLSDDGSSDEDDDATFHEVDSGTSGTRPASPSQMQGDQSSVPVSGQKRKRRPSSGGRQRKRKIRRKTNFLPKAHLFDAMAWQLISMAARMAEALDIHNEASYYGLDSSSPESRANAERRLKIWMRVVHCDTQLSIRLGRRGMTDGALTPAWLELLRSSAFKVLETGPVKLRGPAHVDDARISSRRSRIVAEAEQAARVEGLSTPAQKEVRDRMNWWVETRAFAELMETVANAHTMIHLKSSTTEAILLDDKFEVTLRCIRTSLEAWARWTSERVGNTMSALRLRLEYHEARLYAYGPALDALVQRISRARSSGFAQANDMLAANENLLIHPAYPFAVEAVGAAQTMIRMLTGQVESLRCAPARYFLLIVYASLFLLKATAASSVLLPLKRCLASVQAVIHTLLVAGPDRTHLCRRYALLIREYAKQFIMLEVEDGSTTKMQTPVVGASDNFAGPTNGQAHAHDELSGHATATSALPSTAEVPPMAGSISQAQTAPSLPAHAGLHATSGTDTWPSSGLTPALTSLYGSFPQPTGSSQVGHQGNAALGISAGGTGNGGGGVDLLRAYDWMWDDMVNPNLAGGNEVIDVDDFLQWLDAAGGAPTSGGSALGSTVAMNFEQGNNGSEEVTSAMTSQGQLQPFSTPVSSNALHHHGYTAGASVPTSTPGMMAPAAQTPSNFASVPGAKADDEIAMLIDGGGDRGAGGGGASLGSGRPPGIGDLLGSDGPVNVDEFMLMNGGSAAAASANLGVGTAAAPGGPELGQSGGAGGGDLRNLTDGWFASVMGSINRMT
ncbi:zinc finger transcriptional activator [Tilletia horrida]|uniref:Zinc finger transcriptional activator n=1 Tax=Tilletia horrida TaxID=155126 RepID=A0AAN6GSC7_9BASI|nr:zinc finger transcriptional activator [Tilletia horrida]